MSNPLVELGRAGQSIWYDQMERALLESGTLQKLIERDDLRGLTSNPTIFEKAIGGSHDYDEALERLAASGAGRDAIYEALVIEDIGNAADLFRPVWEKTGHADGYVSLEVSPLLAHDTSRTVEEGRNLASRLGRDNVMIKVPATPEGIPAIEELIAAGVSVNVTLIFSRERYEEVIEAYLRGLERRASNGEPLENVRSVASFFVSRIDTKADAAIRKAIEQGGDASDLKPLLGKVAIANAKLAYRLFQEKFSGDRWKPLEAKGARVQRPLWASTGTKDPSYSDVLYIENLIGPDTVNTIPPRTYDAFRDHGKVERTLDRDLEEAEQVLERLERAGISLKKITDELTVEGVRSFADSFESLIATIDARREAALRSVSGREVHSLGKAQARVDEALARIKADKVVDRIWKKDASLWKSESEHTKIIEASLGWLTVPGWTLARTRELTEFAESIRGEFDHAVVLGMGGSSLCSEVLRTAFPRREGWPRLHVLDSTVPEAVRRLEAQLDLRRTLFIVASKSGTTTEPMMFQKYFWERVRELTGSPGASFIAITDPDTVLQRQAEREGYRHVFLNPPDIGGRYSALSLFGMVPAAIAGIDVEAILGAAGAASLACSPAVPAEDNPAARLGAAIGAMAAEGRDKVTIVCSGALAAFGLWIEQLVAESTGKEGKGILPIAQEPLEAPQAYGADRLFVRIRLASENADSEARAIERFREAGHPVMERVLPSAAALGEEFFIWELATAISGWMLGINPFDQPNVQESKDNTKQLLERFRNEGSLPKPHHLGGSEGIEVFGDARWSSTGSASLAELVESLLSTARPGDYLAFLLYLAESDERNRQVAAMRSEVMEVFRIATTAGYGPRFLHSTGQLHKGGTDQGLFLQITGEEGGDLPIVGEPFGFSTLAAAQAGGDFQALDSRKRRALRIHLEDVDRGLEKLATAIERAAAAIPRS